MTTDTSEKGLESLICAALTGAGCEPPQDGEVHERPSGYGAGWVAGNSQDYDREYCVDLAHLSAFLHATQPKVAESLDLGQGSPTRRRFLARLEGEVTKRGTVDVLRKGVKHGPHQIDLFYGTPSPGNEKARVRYGQNRFSVTRQLHYSRDKAQLALDLCLFTAAIRGKPAVVEYWPDTELRDTEQIPLTEDGGIEAFLRREVLPYAPDAWYVPGTVKVGYEISFTRHFYRPQPLRPLGEIRTDILALERETEGLLAGIVG